MSRAKGEFIRCEICGAALKKKNLAAHVLKAHPEKKKDIISSQPRFRGKGFDSQKLTGRQKEGWVKYFEAHLAREEKDYDRAILILKSLEAEYPLNVDVEYELGLSYFGREDYKKALSAFQKTAAMMPNYYGVKKSIRKCNDALSALSPGDIPPSLACKMEASAEEALDEGRCELAQTIMQRILAVYPHAVSALDLMGRIKNEKRDYDIATRYFLRASKLAPEDPASYANLGFSLIEMGRYEEGFESYKKAIELDPDILQAWQNSGIALMNMGKKEEALEHFDRAIEINKDYYMAWYSRSLVLDDMGRKEEADESRLTALRLNPSYVLRSALGMEKSHKSGMTKDTKMRKNRWWV